jgi:hypothetical protein
VRTPFAGSISAPLHFGGRSTGMACYPFKYRSKRSDIT